MFKKERFQKLAGLLKEEKDLQECGCDEEMPELHPDKINVVDDNEGAMAKSQLELVKHHAEDLMEKLPNDAQLDGWVQSKITIASDMLDTVAHYLQDEVEHDDSSEEVSLEDELEEMDLSLNEQAVDISQYKKWLQQLNDVYHGMKRAGVQPSDHLVHAINDLVNFVRG